MTGPIPRLAVQAKAERAAAIDDQPLTDDHSVLTMVHF